MTMDKYIVSFPEQLEDAMKIAEASNIEASTINAVVISGLGGSGIGGSLITDLFSQDCKVPIIVNKDYSIPAFVNNQTLVIISSYSGNTEETIAAYEQAKLKNAKIIVVSSGGKIVEDAKRNNISCIILPGGNPPRTCLGYSFVQLVSILEKFKLISDGSLKSVETLANHLRNNLVQIQKVAFEISEKIGDKIPVIYGSSKTESVALRFRQQINENSKMLCWHHVFPEMNHNELVGWASNQENIVVLIIKTDFENLRVLKRIEICEGIFKKYTKSVFEIGGHGETFLQQVFYLIHLTDWVSWYLAERKKVDAVEVNVIDFLKNELSKA